MKSSSSHIDYVGGMILKNGKRQMFRFLGGYYEFGEKVDTISDCHYYIADYLGNNRMVVNASTDEVEQVNHYYAYGGLIGNLCYTKDSLSNDFKFGDKKLDRTYGLDLYDFEARQYDAIAPWFTSIDPLAEKFTWLTPYNYCSGNPVMFVDPDGRDNYRYDKKSGNFYLMEKTDDKTDQVFRYKYHKKTNSYK